MTSTTPSGPSAEPSAVDPAAALRRRAEQLGAEVEALPRGRVPRDLRRRHVLAVATVAFIERGYAGVSMDAIAADAGVSKPVVYDLVASKERLFHEVMAEAADELAQRVADAVAEEPDPERKLFAGALAFFGWVDERRTAWSSLLSSTAGPESTEVAAIRARQTELVAALLAEGAEPAAGVDGAGAVDPEQLDAVAHAINGAFESLSGWWQDHPDRTPEELATLLTALILPGLLSLGATG